MRKFSKDKDYDISLDIVIPVLNGEIYLDYALNSLESLTKKPDKIILIDNASKDNSFQILESWANNTQNVELYRNKSELNFSDNWNYGLTKTKSEFVHFLACDDVLTKDFIETFGKIVHKFPEADAISMRVETINQENKKLQKKFSIPVERRLNSNQYLVKTLSKNPFNLAGGIFRREKLIEIGFMDNKYHLWADWVLWRKLLESGNVIRSLRIGSQYRVHSGMEKRKERYEYIEKDLRTFIERQVNPMVNLNLISEIQYRKIVRNLEKSVWKDAAIEMNGK